MNPAYTYNFDERDFIISDLGYDDYKHYLKSDIWQQIKQQVYDRDSYKCTECRCVENIVAHHKHYSRENLTGKDITDIVTLCKTCHYHKHYVPVTVDDLAPLICKVATAAKNCKYKFRTRKYLKENRLEVSYMYSNSYETVHWTLLFRPDHYTVNKKKYYYSKNIVDAILLKMILPLEKALKKIEQDYKELKNIIFTELNKARNTNNLPTIKDEVQFWRVVDALAG